MAKRKDVNETPSLALMLKQISEEYPHLIIPANAPREVRRVQTGVFQIDRILQGGIPLNRLNLFCGQKASFKTTLSLKTLKNFLMTYPETHAVYIDAERALDVDLLRRMKMPVDRIHIMKPDFGEQACEYAEQFSALPEVGCIVIDSLARLNGKTEVEKGYFDSMSRGIRAALISRVTRALVALIDTVDPKLVIMINHLLPYVDGRTQGEYTPGGKSQIYYSSVVLKTWTTGKGENRIKFDDFDSDGISMQRKDIGFLVENSKTSSDNVSGEFSLFLGEDEGDGIVYGDTDDCSLVFDYMKRFGFMVASPPFEFHGQKFNSKIAVYRYWRKTPGLYEKVKGELIENLKSRFRR